MIVVAAPRSDPAIALADALRRVMATASCPKYLSDAATPWLAQQASKT